MKAVHFFIGAILCALMAIGMVNFLGPKICPCMEQITFSSIRGKNLNPMDENKGAFTTKTITAPEMELMGEGVNLSDVDEADDVSLYYEDDNAHKGGYEDDDNAHDLSGDCIDSLPIEENIQTAKKLPKGDPYPDDTEEMDSAVLYYQNKGVNLPPSDVKIIDKCAKYRRKRKNFPCDGVRDISPERNKE